MHRSAAVLSLAVGLSLVAGTVPRAEQDTLGKHRLPHLADRRRAGRLRSGRAAPPLVRIRRCEGSVRRGAERRSGLRDGVLGRGDDLQPSPVERRRRPTRPAPRWPGSAPPRDARLAKAGERQGGDWLRAVEALYGEGEKLTRDTAYAAEMRRMFEQVSGRSRGQGVLRAGDCSAPATAGATLPPTCGRPRSSRTWSAPTPSTPARFTT